jgi:predicted PurR-regulated permease PerM
LKAISSSSISKGILIFLAFAALVISYIFLSRVYVSLTLAFVLAYLLNPIVEWFQKKLKLDREWGALVALVIFLLLVSLMLVLIVPKLTAQGAELMKRIPQIYATLSLKLEPISVRIFGYNVFQKFQYALW